eukprot:2945124-Ditylum_brightwellii.AAC.1
MDKTYEYNAFKSLSKGGRKSKDHVMICVHLVYGAKQHGRCKARLVARYHMIGPKTDTYYSSVVSLRAIRTMIFLAELNGMKMVAADIGNAYLEAYTYEKICFIA